MVAGGGTHGAPDRGRDRAGAFAASNSPAFHLAGLVHPRLRTALLPRELLNKQRVSIRVNIGRAWDPLPATDEDDTAVLRRLRAAAYSLELATGRTAAAKSPAAAGQAIAAPADAERLAEEIAALPDGSCLAEHGPLIACLANAGQIPTVIDEIGRLREVTFRQVGEGTGLARDLDRFDPHYEHLFVWHREARELVGAYRIGRSDQILREHGVTGLYTSTLFRYGLPFLARLGPALELGRSFVRPEYQRSYLPLMLLWKGIGAVVHSSPRHATLFGPASLSAALGRPCLELIVSYLRNHHGDARLSRHVTALRPFRSTASRALRHELARLDSLDDLESVLAALDSDCPGMPVLLRQYLKLGAVVTAVGVDPAFSDSVDCLIVTDLRRTADRALERYLGRDGLREFRAIHQPVTASRISTAATRRRIVTA